MADVRIDARDLAVVLDALNGILEDGEFDLMPTERTAYERLCKIAGVEPITEYEQQSLGFLEDEPPRGRGVMADYINRFRGGGGGRPWHEPPPPPPPDVAKEIADKMARASKEAVTGQTPKPKPDEPKRPLTDEEREAVRRALDGD